MKHLFLTGALVCAGSIVMVGCGSDTNVSVNANTNRGTANSNSNGNSSTTGSAMNSMGNAMNSVANTASNMTGSSADSPNAFLTDAAQGGMAEVELGKLAGQKAQSPEVKKFGQMMVTDHTAANNELKTVAGKKNVTVPTDVGSKHKSDMDSMSKLSGAEFDKQYVEMMVNDHEEDVSKFQKQADTATDPDVKAFAMKTLPTLKKHLDAIKAIQAKMK
jgi:putative membrane protein